jgi:penicillin-insensitive murein endopeptidase
MIVARSFLFMALALGAAGCERETKLAPAPAAPGPVPIPIEAPAAAHFAAVQRATNGAPRVYGTYTRGCIGGAEQLSRNSPYWQVLNPSRNRAWGHPALIRLVHRLAEAVAADGHRGLLVGDLAQPRGGPTPSDHNSHQVGLDADIWLTPMPARKLDANEIENYEPPSMVDFDRLKVNHLFGAAQVSMLSHAARASEVERIFVSPPIKRALCERARGDRSWLRKIRPWRGHSAHMHVRLGCPADSVGCTSQEPPPAGDGCGAELQSWFDDRSWMREAPGRYEPDTAIKLDALPAACKALLVEQG